MLSDQTGGVALRVIDLGGKLPKGEALISSKRDLSLLKKIT